MELLNCSVCGRLFKSDAYSICSRCIDEQDGPYQKVMKYVYDHYGATVLEVAEATGVEVKLILKYIKDGSVNVIDKSNK